MEPSSTAPADWDLFRRHMPSSRQWAYLDHAAVAPLSGPAQRGPGPVGRRCHGQRVGKLPAWTRQVERATGPGRRHDRGRARGNRPNWQHHGGHQSGRRGLSLEAWRQRGHCRRRVSLEPVSVAPFGRSGGGNPPRPHRRRAARPGSARRRLRRADADRQPELGGLCQRLAARFGQLAELVHAGGPCCSSTPSRPWACFPLDVRTTPVDFLAADGHKWLLGPEGAGVFFTRREHLEPAPARWAWAGTASRNATISAASSWCSKTRPLATRAVRRTSPG